MPVPSPQTSAWSESLLVQDNRTGITWISQDKNSLHWPVNSVWLERVLKKLKRSSNQSFLKPPGPCLTTRNKHILFLFFNKVENQRKLKRKKKQQLWKLSGRVCISLWVILDDSWLDMHLAYCTGKSRLSSVLYRDTQQGAGSNLEAKLKFI